jgi:serine/threonine protein kinase
MPPEIFLGRTHSTPKIDVWAIGCMLHAMVLGEYPFNSSDREDLKK